MLLQNRDAVLQDSAAMCNSSCEIFMGGINLLAHPKLCPLTVVSCFSPPNPSWFHGNHT